MKELESISYWLSVVSCALTLFALTVVPTIAYVIWRRARAAWRKR